MASNVIKCPGCNLVICEVLAFVKNKLDVMDEDSLSKICATAFSPEEIFSAKKLLFDSIPSSQQLKIRKGDKKTQRDIDDIITLLKQTDPEIVPVFVARDLQKLPPITFDHVDVTRLLKDILVLREELKIVKDSFVTKETFNDLQKNVDAIKTSTPSFKDEYCNVNMNKRDCRRQNEFNCDSGPMGLYHFSQSSPNCDNTSPINRSSNETFVNSYREIINTNVGRSNGQKLVNTSCAPTIPRMSNQVIGTVDAMTNVKTNIPNNVQTKPPLSHSPIVHAKSPMLQTDSDSAHLKQRMSQPESRTTLADIIKAPGEWKTGDRTGEWTLVQKKRLRNRIIGKIGAAATEPNGKFKAAEIKIPLFIYNVNKSSTHSDISAHIYKKSQVHVTINKLDTKSDKGYDAYKVLVPKHKLDIFLNENFWPEGVLFRRFVEFSKPKVKDKAGQDPING